MILNVINNFIRQIKKVEMDSNAEKQEEPAQPSENQGNQISQNVQRKTYHLLGKPGSLIARDTTPTPTSGELNSVRENNNTPLMPQGSLYMNEQFDYNINSKQPTPLDMTLHGASQVYKETEEEQHEGSSLPSGVVASQNSFQAVSDHSSHIDMTNASKSAYRHHLPRKGQPGCRKITSGVLGWNRSSVPRQRIICESGMYSLDIGSAGFVKLDSPQQAKNQQFMSVKINRNGICQEESKPEIVNIELKRHQNLAIPKTPATLPSELNPEFLGLVRARARAQVQINSKNVAQEITASFSPPKRRGLLTRGAETHQRGRPRILYHRPVNSDLIDDGVASTGKKQMMIVGALPQEQSKQLITSATLPNEVVGVKNGQQNASQIDGMCNVGYIASQDTYSAGNYNVINGKKRKSLEKKRLSTQKDRGDGIDAENSFMASFYGQSPSQSTLHKTGMKLAEGEFMLRKKQILQSDERDYGNFGQKQGSYMHTRISKSVDSSKQQDSQEMRVKIEEKSHMRVKQKVHIKPKPPTLLEKEPSTQMSISHQQPIENPYNVTSFKKKKQSQASDRQDSKFGNSKKEAMPTEHLKPKSPDIVTVAVLDKTNYNNKAKLTAANPVNNLKLEQIMYKKPKMTTYEQLKRPKTNRIDLDPIGKQLGETAGTISINNTGIVTNFGSEDSRSTKMIPMASAASRQKELTGGDFAYDKLINSEFHSAQERSRRPQFVNAKAELQSNSTVGSNKQKIKISQQDYRQQFPGKKKTNLSRKKRFDSLNNTYEMNQTTGEYAMKAFANSFQKVIPLGGNQLSMTKQLMMQNTVIVQNASRSKYTQQRPSLQTQIQAVQAKLATSSEIARLSSAATNSVSNSTDLFINGSRARPPINYANHRRQPFHETYDFVTRGYDKHKPLQIAPFNSVEYARQQVYDVKNSISPMMLPLSNDSSRSPIPIDPETSRRMMMQLPPNLDSSSLGQTSRNQLSVRDPSHIQSPTGSHVSIGHFPYKSLQPSGQRTEVIQCQPALMVMEETPEGLVEGDSMEIFFRPSNDMPVLETTTNSDPHLKQVGQQKQRVTIASRQSDQLRKTDNIKEVNCHFLEQQTNGDPNTDRQLDQSKLTSGSKRNGGRMNSSLDASMQDQSMVERESSKIEKSRLEQRLFVEGQGQKEVKKVVIQTYREETGQKQRKKRLMAAGRFKSMGDTSNLPVGCELSVAACKIESSSLGSSQIDEDTTIIHQHHQPSATAKMKTILNRTSLEAVRAAKTQIEGRSSGASDPVQVEAVLQEFLLQQQRSQNGSMTRQPEKLACQDKPISRPAIETIKKLHEISTEKICNETTVILDGRLSDRSRGGDFEPITPKYTKAALNSVKHIDRFGAGSVAAWQNKSSIGNIGEEATPPSTVVTEMTMFEKGMSRETTQIEKSAEAQIAMKSGRTIGRVRGERASKIPAKENNDIASQLIGSQQEDSMQSLKEDNLIGKNTSFLRIDDHALTAYHKSDYGMIDFAAQKAREFLLIQGSLPRLDHNTMGSDAESALNLRADKILKSIALQSKIVPQNKNFGIKTGSVQVSNDINDEFNQKRNKMIKNEIPTQYVKFKNKSERERYLRVVKCIIQLPSHGETYQYSLQKAPKMKKTDIEFMYMKIFRFLADTLSQKEFESLSYYHVASFIQRVMKFTNAYEADPTIASKNDKLPDSLRHFVCVALDLRYEQSKLSQDMLALENQRTASASLVKPLWHVNKLIPLEEQYPPKNYHEPINKQLVQQCAETRHAIIHDKMKKKANSMALEPGLPTVVQNSLTRKGQETMQRGNVARLLQVNKRQNDLDVNMRQESNIARNKVVLEHIVYQRNLKDWRDQVLSELHEEQRNAKSVSNSRRSTRHKHLH